MPASPLLPHASAITVTGDERGRYAVGAWLMPMKRDLLPFAPLMLKAPLFNW